MLVWPVWPANTRLIWRFEKAYGKNLYHMHIHNNFRENDDHANLSNGTLDFYEIFNCLKETQASPSFVFEMYSEEDIRNSYKIFNEINN